MTTSHLPHHQLQPSPLNPRKHQRSPEQIAALAASIAKDGILQNLVVRPSDAGYEIAAGEGRWRAVTHLIDEGKVTGDFELPVVVRELSDEEVIEIGLIENTQRHDLTPMDEARAFLHLVELQAGSGGKAAAAKAIERIAERINRTRRYVQQRVKLARDLVPEWAELLEAGHLKLSVARVLASVPAKEQRDVYNDFAKTDDGEIDVDGVARMQPGDIFQDELRPMKTALFDVDLADLETVEIEGEVYAVDTAAFDKLQKERAAKLTKELRAAAKAGEIAFFDEVEWLDNRKYEQQKIDGTPDATAGAVMVKAYDGAIELYRGMLKTEAAVKAEAREKARKVEATKKAKAKRADDAPKKLPPDPRIKIVAEKLKSDERLQLALSLLEMISSEYSDTPKWLSVFTETDAARATLTKLAGKPPAAGAKLLAWLLEQKVSVMAAAMAAARHVEISSWPDSLQKIENPSTVEQLLFDHCGATLPDELALPKVTKNAKAAGQTRTASKSKPKPKAKKGKK